MEITPDNVKHAREAIKDILFMYVDLIQSYGGFGHNIATGRFRAIELIDVGLYEERDYDSFKVDISLLQAGSAISLLCKLSDAWDENGSWNVGTLPFVDTKRAYEAGRFDHLPEIHKAFSLGFGSNEEAFRNQLAKVYRQHVCGYFSNLTMSCSAPVDGINVKPSSPEIS